MAKSKSYEMLLKIAGKTDSSLKAACNTAAKNIDALERRRLVPPPWEP